MAEPKDLTPRCRDPRVKRIDLRELGVSLRTSDEALAQIEAMKLEQAVAWERRGRHYIFD